MSPTEAAAFWVWYKTGLENKGRRSFTKAARILGRDVSSIATIADEQDWEGLARIKDAEISRKLDDAVIDAIVTDSKEILSRQRLIIRGLYKRISAAIESGDLEPNLAGIIALMRYEAEVGGAIKPAGSGLSLNVILQSLPSETRGAIHRALREYRDKSRAGNGLPGEPRGVNNN